MLARKCDNCSSFIDTMYFDIGLAKKRTDEGPEQDANHVYGEYCKDCVISGKAIEDLIEAAKEKK